MIGIDHYRRNDSHHDLTGQDSTTPNIVYLTASRPTFLRSRGDTEVVKIYQVDAFTDRQFAGNPAAVCILTKSLDDAWYANVAMEMNLSETAFLVRQPDGFDLRWFTPTVEVDLCGHATLASAHVLYETGVLLPDDTARFHTRSGLLTATHRDGWIEMDFPALPVERAQTPEGLETALGTALKYVGLSAHDYLVEIESAGVLRKMQQDFAALKSLNVRGVIVTSTSDSPEYDFISRFFAPGAGIDKDPVTGSAHCALGPYWQQHLNKTEFTAYQASKRGGTIGVRVEDKRVLLRGQAVTVFEAEISE